MSTKLILGSLLALADIVKAQKATMKTAKKTVKNLCLAICCVGAINMEAQPWYGQKYYRHITLLSSAKRTFNSPGYVLAGFEPSRTPNPAIPNFAIDKLDPAGTYVGSGSFNMEYLIQADTTTCQTPVNVNNCYGVSIVEISGAFAAGRQEQYAIAGAFSKGMFFATLDASGNIVSQNFWPFLNPVNFYVDIHKPALRESESTPGEFYICGSYDRQGYVVKVDINANQIWGNWYSHVLTIRPRDLIESPYKQNELVVVGRIDMLWDTSAANGMFMQLNASTGALVDSLKYYNCSDENDDWFACIQKAPGQAAAQNGYILGGRSVGLHYVRNTQWMCKLDPDGNVIWSTLIKPGAFNYDSILGTEITNVYHRYNPNTSQDEFYGVAGSLFTWDPTGAAGLVYQRDNVVVYKLDQNGQNSLSPNEFHYLGGMAASGLLHRQIYGYCDISGIETGGGSDDGIQVYASEVRNSTHYFVKGYFNGLSGCNDTIGNIDSVFVGPLHDRDTLPIVQSIAPCPMGINLVASPAHPHITSPCDNSSLPNGSNLKTATGIAELTAKSEAQIKVYPNPSSGEVFISVPPAINDPVNVTVFNNLGQKIKEYRFKNAAGDYPVDLNALQLKAGLYSIQVRTSSLNNNYKIVYEPK